MNKQLLIRELDLASMKKQVPKTRTGHTVKIKEKIKEGDKEREQTFEGLVIRTHGKGGLNSTITVRKISEGIGVEKIFSLHSPSIVDIKIVKIAEIRRSKLYYLRERFGKSARLKELQITDSQRDKLTVNFEPKVKNNAEAPITEEITNKITPEVLNNNLDTSSESTNNEQLNTGTEDNNTEDQK